MNRSALFKSKRIIIFFDLQIVEKGNFDEKNIIISLLNGKVQEGIISEERV